MEKKTITPKELKKRKMLLILPLICLPFVTGVVWALRGDQNTLTASEKEKRQGFNIVLPDPEFREDLTLDKLSYYNQATADSIKEQEELRKDPNYSNRLSLGDSLSNYEELGSGAPRFRKGKTALNTAAYRSVNEEKVYQKLMDLQKAIAKPAKDLESDQDMREFEYHNSSTNAAAEMKNLEQLMSAMNAPVAPDPELKQLGGMLENILDIQHPERVQEKLRLASKKQKGKVFEVSKIIKEEAVSSLQASNQNSSKDKTNAFYSLDADFVTDEVHNALEAVVHDTQTIVNGSVVKLRLTSAVFISGVLIPRNSFVFGTAALKGERLEVKISNVQFKNAIFPVELSVYDLDAIEGIYIPGAIGRDVAKASADRSMQSVGIANLDDSWGAQAAGMGMEAAKSFLSKKVKRIKVVVKAGYRVLLYDEKDKNAK